MNNLPTRTRLALAFIFACVTFSPAAESSAPSSTAPDKAALDKMAGQLVPPQQNLVWKRIDLAIEWGFKPGTENFAFDGSIASTYQFGMVGKAVPLPGDTATTMTGDLTWKSPGAGTGRRGIVVPVLYTPAVRGPARTILTVRTASGSFSFQPVDLEAGPILAPEYGFFVANAAAKMSAQTFQQELAAKRALTVRQRVREKPEQTLEAAVRSLHGDLQLPPMPEPAFEPAMSVSVPDRHLTGLWRLGAWGIIRRCATNAQGAYIVADHPFPPLGCETDRILWALDHQGMHRVARDGMANWLEHQQPDGALTLNSDMENMHKIGALQILWVMTEHYRFTRDKAWLAQQGPRLKAAADWILNRRRATMKEPLSPEEIEGLKTGKWSPYGLQPRISMGDGDSSGSRYYYWADAFGYQSVKLFANIVADLDPQLGAHYSAEVEKYRADILPILNQSILLSPVMKVQDGTYRSFHPQGFQDRGPLTRALPEGANVFTHCGPYHADYAITSAAIEAWLRSGVLSIDDPRLDGHFDVLEDVFLWDHPWFRVRKKDYLPERDWFDFGWAYQSGWERLPEYYLLKDDVPNFLRSWLNRCAVDLNFKPDPERVWTFNEHTVAAENDKSHERAVFLSNFRNLLVMEIDDTLWLARATPRAWLEQGKQITVRHSPTYFGTTAFSIVSDVEHGRISATIELPSRNPPKAVQLRFRHPQARPIKSVTVDGRNWTDFDKEKEVVRLTGVQGKATVIANY